MGLLGRAIRGRYTHAAMVDVVVINHDPEVLEALGTVIESAGYPVALRHAQDPVDRLAAFIREPDPRIVVYDMGPPLMEKAVRLRPRARRGHDAPREQPRWRPLGMAYDVQLPGLRRHLHALDAAPLVNVDGRVQAGKPTVHWSPREPGGKEA